MTRAAVAVLCLLALVLVAPDAHAYPWMIRHQQTECSTCHVDPSGGELLTPYGRLQGLELLPFRWRTPKDTDELPAMTPAWGLIKTPSWLMLGASYRHVLLSTWSPDRVRTFPMQADVYGQANLGRFFVGGSLGVGRVPIGSPHLRGAQLTSDQGDGWNLISRQHYIGYSPGGGLMLRAGRLGLPFGLRIPEHISWVRTFTRTDRESDHQHGVALSYVGPAWRAEAMIIAGNYQIHPDVLRERGAAGYVEARLSATSAVGISSLATHAEADLATLENRGVTRQAYGAFARYSPAKPLVILLEADTLLTSRRDQGYVGFAQVDIEPWQGLHLALTGEVGDAGARVGDPRSVGAGQPRFGAWVSLLWFFLPQLDLRLDLMSREGEPVTFLSQIHLYL